MGTNLTIKDIARIAGVSHSTVSRALNGSPLISAATGERIRCIARERGFEFNAGARRLKNRRTGIVGVVYYSALNDFRASLYTNELFRDLRHGLEAVELDALVVEAYDAASGASNIERLIRQAKVDGFVIIHPEIRREDYGLIQSSGLPTVHLHMASEAVPRGTTDFFFTDGYHGGRLAARRLVDQGCRRIMTVRTCRRESPEFRRRTEGFLSVVRETELHSVRDASLVWSSTYESGTRLFGEQRERILACDGLFFQADIVAFGFLNSLRGTGIRVPEDIRVIGYDDSPVSRLSLPPLTTIHQPREELARRACERMRSLLFDGTPGESVREYVKPSLTIRDSG